MAWGPVQPYDAAQPAAFGRGDRDDGIVNIYVGHANIRSLRECFPRWENIREFFNLLSLFLQPLAPITIYLFSFRQRTLRTFASSFFPVAFSSIASFMRSNQDPPSFFG